MAISVNAAKKRIETDLPDETVQLIIDAETEAMERHAVGTTETELQDGRGLRFLVLKRKAASITSITERRFYTSDTETVLNADDYRLLGGFKLFRLNTGTNPFNDWGEETTIVYTPEVDTNLRDRVVLDLVQLSVEFNAYQAEKAGDWTGNQGDYKERRESVLNQLREPRRLVV